MNSEFGGSVENEVVELRNRVLRIEEALRRRGVADPAAGLTGEVAIAIFRLSFESWVADDDAATLSERIIASFDELRVVAAGT